MVTTQIHTNVDINGGLTLVQNVAEFPSSPRVGQFVQKDGIIYTYGDTGTGVLSWLPISIRRTTYVHQQVIPSDTWIITHNLNTTDYGIIVYDENRNVVSTAPSEPIDEDSVRVSLTTPISGTAILIAVTDFSATSITSSSLILGGSAVTVNNGTLLVDSAAVASEDQLTAHITAADPHPQYAMQTQLGTVLAGYPVIIDNELLAGDHIEFTGSKWTSINRTKLVDGGSF